MSESLAATFKPDQTSVYLKDYVVPTYCVDEIHLQFELNDDVTEVTSQLQVRRNRLSESQMHDFMLNGDGLALIEIKLNHQVLTKEQYRVTEKLLTIYQVPNHFTLEIKTHIYPQNNTALSGLYRSGNTYCTQCEAEGFRRITYFPDHPDILSRYTTVIRADETRYPYLLSNGNLIEKGKLPGGRHYAKWEDPFKKPSYLFALVAGDFDKVQDTFTTQSGQMIALNIYVEKGYGDQVDHAMYSLKAAMRFDEQEYGREYDLDTYMIVAIGDFNMGAMENKGLNIFNTKYILAKPDTATDDDYIHILSVIGHEYFHNWSGNRVTCRDWFQLSLKEGLTIFRDQTFTENVISPSVMRIRDVQYLRETQFPEDAGPLAHPVRPDCYMEINNFYTATIYNKGAEVLRMLQTILGKSLFRKGMDLYFARHDGQAVTIDDFIKAMEDVSGIDLIQFRLWYSQAGTPVVTVEDDYDPSHQLYTLSLHQKTPPTPGQPDKLPLFIPIRMGLLNHKGQALPLKGQFSQKKENGSEIEKVLFFTENTQTFQFKEVNERPILSLLRNFSAPVKLHYSYSDEELIFLFKHDSDAFNRFESLQYYALRVLMQLIRDYQQQKKLILPQAWVDMMVYLLQQNHEDKLWVAETLRVPSEIYMAEQMPVVDVDAIHAVREFVLSELAKALQSLFLQTYQANHAYSGVYHFNAQALAQRQLKNACLSYLMHLPAHWELGEKQFALALNLNMTDTQAALTALVNSGSSLREQALAQFYTTWHHDALVVDKWLAIQAAAKVKSALSEVKKLWQHQSFDKKNPNKVYALIGTFCHRNPVHFHAEDGEGYAFLREVVQELDALNPQVAARMVKPLTTWRRYDKERQGLMLTQLKQLLESNKLSKDVYELVTKSL